MKSIEIIGANYAGNWDRARRACRAILAKDGKILCSYETVTDQWMIPGGGLEDGESEEACCIREVREETGFLIRPSECFLEIDEYYQHERFISRYFTGEITGETERLLTAWERETGMEPRWIPLEEILKIFSQYASYAETDQMRRGLYYREYRALCEYVRIAETGGEKL